MSRILIGIFAWFWVGVVAAEVINTAELLFFHLNPFVFGAVAGALFAGVDFFLDRMRSGKVKPDHPDAQRAMNAYYFWIGGICLCILLSIPFLWWGVIKKLAMG